MKETISEKPVKITEEKKVESNRIQIEEPTLAK